MLSLDGCLIRCRRKAAPERGSGDHSAVSHVSPVSNCCPRCLRVPVIRSDCSDTKGSLAGEGVWLGPGPPWPERVAHRRVAGTGLRGRSNSTTASPLTTSQDKQSPSIVLKATPMSSNTGRRASQRKGCADRDHQCSLQCSVYPGIIPSNVTPSDSKASEGRT